MQAVVNDKAINFDPITAIELEAMVSFIGQQIPYDFRIGRILRTISEAVHFGGRYWNSTQAKSRNKFISLGASELLARCRKREFEQQTVLEHPLPIKWMYLDRPMPLGSHGSDVSVQFVVDTMRATPLITVLSKEDKRLPHHSERLTPRQRYEKAKIKVGRVDSIEPGKPCNFVEDETLLDV